MAGPATMDIHTSVHKIFIIYEINFNLGAISMKFYDILIESRRHKSAELNRGQVKHSLTYYSYIHTCMYTYVCI